MSLYQQKKFAALDHTVQTITAGATATVASAQGPIQVYIDPAATLAALALTLPATPVDKQTVTVSFGGTMTAGNVVTAMSVVPGAGTTVLEPAAPGAVAAGKSIAYRYNVAKTKWYRLY